MPRKNLLELITVEWTAFKRRRPRKPMTKEQRKEHQNVLAKAREARTCKEPRLWKIRFHESLRSLPDDYGLSPTNIKKWIKTQKELVKVCSSKSASENQSAEA